MIGIAWNRSPTGAARFALLLATPIVGATGVPKLPGMFASAGIAFTPISAV